MIEKPGIYQITAEDYHADPCPAPSLSASLLRVLNAESPKHAWSQHPRLNPDYKAGEKIAFDIGSAAHALLFEGEDRMEVCDFADWRKKDAQEQRDMARAAGKHPVLTHQYEAIKLMVAAAASAWNECPDLADYRLEDGKSEQSIIWTEGETWLKCRPDWMSTDRRVMLDGKFTAGSANPNAFTRQIENMGYDSRGAFYLRGNRSTGAPEDCLYIFLVQEVAPPYVSAFVGLAPSYVTLGDSKVEAAINAWRACMSSGVWPGYTNRIHWVEPPTWAESQWMERQGSGSQDDPAIGIEYDISKIWQKPEGK